MEGTFHKGSIVVGVDGSPVGTSALDWAAEQASHRHLPVHLVHAFAPDLPTLGFGVGLGIDEIRQSGKRLLAGATARTHAHDRSIEVSSVCTSGFASAALIRASRDARVVVVGAHGYGPFNMSALGAVALQVATHAHSPVAVIRHAQATAPFGRVVVGLDGSEASLLALREAFEFAGLTAAELILVHAWRARGHDDPTLRSDSDWPEYERTHHDVVMAAVAQHTRDHNNVKVIQEVVRADPVRVLVDRSRSADLIVVGSRGLGGFPGLLLGSVSQGVLMRSGCPVLITRPPEHHAHHA